MPERSVSLAATPFDVSPAASAIAHVAFPPWAFWVPDAAANRVRFTALIARRPDTVAWNACPTDERFPFHVYAENMQFPEIGRVFLRRRAAARLARFAAKPHRDPFLARTCHEALSGLRRILLDLSPGGVSHARLAGERIPELPHDLRLALSNFAPPESSAVAAPNPLNPDELICRGVTVCSRAQADDLVQRGHVVLLPDGSYRRA